MYTVIRGELNKVCTELALSYESVGLTRHENRLEVEEIYKINRSVCPICDSESTVMFACTMELQDSYCRAPYTINDHNRGYLKCSRCNSNIQLSELRGKIKPPERILDREGLREKRRKLIRSHRTMRILL